jgi:hypothetical protein
MVPNYSKNYAQVVSEAAKDMIRIDNDLILLADVNIGPRSMQSELPRWVPDWRSKTQNHGVLRREGPLFSCTSNLHDQCFVTVDGMKLSARGFEIDRIRDLDKFTAGHEMLQTYLPVEGDSQQSLHTTGETRRIAVIRTPLLRSGCFRRRQQVQECCGEV